MAEIKTGRGILCFGPPGDYPACEIKESELICAIGEKDGIMLNSLQNEAELTIHLSKQQIEKFLQVAFQITKTVLEMLRDIGNKRVAYLARHGKKHRTRKKNIRRAYRMVSRERGYGHE